LVKLTKIYTRGGDSGQTSLGNGKRVSKYDTRVAAYGTVDEANGIIGIARLALTQVIYSAGRNRAGGAPSPGPDRDAPGRAPDRRSGRK